MPIQSAPQIIVIIYVFDILIFIFYFLFFRTRTSNDLLPSLMSTMSAEVGGADDDVRKSRRS